MERREIPIIIIIVIILFYILSADLVKGVFGHSSTVYAIKIKKTSKFEIFGKF